MLVFALTDKDDAIARDAYVGCYRRRAGAVDDTASVNQEVKLLCGCEARRRQSECNNKMQRTSQCFCSFVGGVADDIRCRRKKSASAVYAAIHDRCSRNPCISSGKTSSSYSIPRLPSSRESVTV